MDNLYFDVLNKFYIKLHDNIIRYEKKLTSNSVLITLIKVTSNRSSELLNISSINIKLFNKIHIDRLIESSLIRQSDNDIEEYILTTRGIWEIDKKLKDLTEYTLLDYFQNSKNFTFSDGNKPLTDREKVILLSLIAARSFSSKSPMDLKNVNLMNYWLDIFNSSKQFLVRNNLLKKEVIYEKQGNEHPIAYEMRRANQLPKKTKRLYKFGLNSKQYFLDIDRTESNGSFIKNLSFILSLIFEKIKNFSEIKDIQNYCEKIAYDKAKYVKNDFMYVDSKFDDLIRKTLKSLFLES